MTSSFHAKSLTTLLVNERRTRELRGSEDNEGIKERTGFRRAGCWPTHGTW
ncbi:MAG: hypothetical protein ACLR9W_07080 [Enterobacter hormaechei]